VVEGAYVGQPVPSGWWPSGTGQTSPALNIPDPALLKSVYGIDVNNAADRTLLTSRIDSSALAAQRGFKAPYVGYPGSASVAQTLRPYPPIHWIRAELGNPWGNGW